MSEKPKYADCALITGGRKVAWKYTYALPPEWAGDVVKGSLLLVPARNKLRLAIVVDFPEKAAVEEIRSAVALYTDHPLVNEKQLDAATWLQRYYITPPIRALKPFLLETQTLRIVEYIKPKNTAKLIDKLGGQGFLFLNKSTTDELSAGGSIEKRKFSNYLAQGGFEADVVDKFVNSLIEEGIIEIKFEIDRKRIVSRAETFIRLKISEDSNLPKLTPRQKAVIDFIRDATPPLEKKSLTSAIPDSARVLSGLVKKGLVEEYTGPSSASDEPHLDILLTRQQKDALHEITGLIDKRDASTVLLHGVTGSGKTEVYVQAAHHALESGGQVLVLVPEIALTHQVVRRFARDFPGRLAVLHSEMSQAERAAEWGRIRRHEADIVIGARSALFAPFDNMRLIILDEEHEPSYKQSAIPRYHARELARRMSMLHNAVLVLGSATPSMESYKLALEGKFHLINLPERIMGGELPEIELVKRRFEKVELPGGAIARRLQVITEGLKDAIDDVLNREKQALLFLNQRGFAKCLICPECGKGFECPSCHLPLVHHKKTNAILCHHCGHRRPAPEICPQCGDIKLIGSGVGTQRLEDEVARLFPAHKLYRLDRDTTETRGGSKKVLDDFRKGLARILLGTQMIAKGLDFPDVELVGVISAEDSLAIPDFRAAERTFQLLTQVAGRAGRRKARGRVIVQGIRLDHYSVRAACEYDFPGFYKCESEIRNALGYPPFRHLARIVVLSVDYSKAELSADILGDELRKTGKSFPMVDILGPAPAPLERLRGMWRRHMLFKCDQVSPMSRLIHVVLDKVRFPSDVRVEVDVDPLQMM